MKIRMRAATGLAVIAALTVTLTGCSGSGSGGTTDIEFFQIKTEAVDTYNKLIAEFEKENPKIHVKQVNTPDPDSVMRTRLARNDMPEVINMQAGRYYRELAKAGVLHDWTGDPILHEFTEAGLKANADMAQTGDHPKGLPTSISALPMLYNKKIFADNGIAIPTTWDELIAAAEKLKAAGITPFELPFGDASQALLTFDMVGVSVDAIDYGAKVDFTKAYPEVGKKLQQLKPYGQSDPFGTNYDAATRAFAAGDAAMYPQGVWALAPLEQSNPELEIGAFAFPADKADDGRLITSVDTYTGMSASVEGGKKDAAEKFITFLFSKKAHQQYVDEQYLFPVIKGVDSDKELVQGLQKEYIDAGKVGFYPEELFQSASDVGAVVQRFLQDGDEKSFLGALNSAYSAK